jgi:hypothetical protein
MATDFRSEILVSVDGEFTGPIPGVYSMISLGAAAYDGAGTKLSTFKVNILELEGSIRDPETMEWWSKYPEAWAATQVDQQEPKKAMEQFMTWLLTVGGLPKLGGWPLPVDFMFVYWYWWKFLKSKPPFGYDGIDFKTYAMAKFDIDAMKDVSRKDVQDRLNLPSPEFLHDPVDDAERQADLYFYLRNMRWTEGSGISAVKAAELFRGKRS